LLDIYPKITKKESQGYPSVTEVSFNADEQREKERETERDRERQRETERDRERQRETERDREREMGRESKRCGRKVMGLATLCTN
jgi:hypothetical protein